MFRPSRPAPIVARATERSTDGISRRDVAADNRVAQLDGRPI
jgi:hypothetical protein